MTARRTVTDDERRARLAVRHRLALAWRAVEPVAVARSLVALHSTDPATVYLSAAARVGDPTVAAVERALYDDRSLVRILGMRRTLFVVPSELVPVVHAACTRAIAATQRRRYAKLLEEGRVTDDGAAWLDRVGAATLTAIERRGEAFGAEVSADVPELRSQVSYGEGRKWGGTTSVTTWVLTLLASEERLVRGRPRGSWTSSQYSWAPAPAGASDGELPDTAEAQAELARRWLAAYGPATADDLAWWTGWTKTATRSTLAAVGAVEVDLSGGTGYVLADDVEAAPPEPWAALLPALDPTAMGWSRPGRAFYGGDDDRLYDRSGNVAPTVWWDGRIVGYWAQRRDGEIAVRLTVDGGQGAIGRDAATAIDTEATRLRDWLGATRVTPRFRTPLERELAG